MANGSHPLCIRGWSNVWTRLPSLGQVDDDSPASHENHAPLLYPRDQQKTITRLKKENRRVSCGYARQNDGRNFDKQLLRTTSTPSSGNGNEYVFLSAGYPGHAVTSRVCMLRENTQYRIQLGKSRRLNPSRENSNRHASQKENS